MSVSTLIVAREVFLFCFLTVSVVNLFASELLTKTLKGEKSCKQRSFGSVRSSTNVVSICFHMKCRKAFVYKIQVDSIHVPSQNMAIIMTLRIVNGAVLKSSSQWQLKEF